MRAYFLGVRGSTPAPGESFVRYGGYTSCIAIAHDGEAAPEPRSRRRHRDPPRHVPCAATAPFAGTILLTHLHWDHVHGLPFFAAADREDSRVALFLPEQPDGAHAADVLARAMSPPHFPIGPEGLRGEWSFSSLAPGTLEADGFRIEAREIPHKGGRTYGYRVSDGDVGARLHARSLPERARPGTRQAGASTTWTPSILPREPTLLVHDAQMIAEEMAAAVFFGHAAAEYAVELGRRAGSRRVVLFHHQPDRSDDALDELPRRFGPRPQVIVAAESLVLEL